MDWVKFRYVPGFDSNDYNTLLSQLQDVLLCYMDCATPVVKFFIGTENTAYFYEDTSADSKYVRKVRWTSKTIPADVMENLYYIITISIGSMPHIKYTRLTKKATGYRFRLDDGVTTNEGRRHLTYVFEKASQMLAMYPLPGSNIVADCCCDTNPLDQHVKQEVSNTQGMKVERKTKMMNDFSLTNLKDAIVDKVTHLDKKTVSIIAIIALVLLIVGKYNTIKGLIVGIKDKVTGSDDFKSMIEDGTKAIDSLKKIVGVKNTKSKKGKE